MLRKKFDLVVSLGENCSCASYLRKYKLRDYSYPFDWLYSSTFEKKIQIIANSFEGFLAKGNVQKFVDKDKRVSTHYDNYEDLGTGLRFIHDFPVGVDFGEAYDEVYAKYQRRIARLYDRGAQAKEILFVWLSLESDIPAETVLDAQQSLSKRFNKDVNVLVIENDSSLGAVEEENVSLCAVKVRGPFDTGKGFDHNENTLLDTVFSKINGRKKYSYAILKALLRLCCCIIPNRNLRRKIRNAN